jgi:hypothetical protein
MDPATADCDCYAPASAEAGTTDSRTKLFLATSLPPFFSFVFRPQEKSKISGEEEMR